MTPQDRAALEQAARRLARLAAAADLASLKAAALPKIAAQFDGIAAGVQAAAPSLAGATVTVNHLYDLNATDLKSEQDTQFFCGIGGTPLSVVLNFQSLPPGHYALALLHATGVKQPQQMAFVLALDGSWKLAGFYARPLQVASRDSLWYWVQAREMAKKKQLWNAYFYYQTAQYLTTPVDFMGSPNLDKLQKEREAVTPPGLPDAQPMALAAGGRTWKITSLRTDGSLGTLDLAIRYEAASGSADPVVQRQEAVALMKAFLMQYPEIREGFHGLWVYADSPGRGPFAIELPMNQIP